MSITLKDMDLVAEEGRDLCISLWLISLSAVPGAQRPSARTSAPQSILNCTYYASGIALVTLCHCVLCLSPPQKGDPTKAGTLSHSPWLPPAPSS